MATIQKCRPCDGGGRDLEDGTICGKCRNGRAECPACEGTGRLIDEEGSFTANDCSVCDGRGGCAEVLAERYLAFMAKVEADAALHASDYGVMVDQAGA